jgi:hypothetical protein
VQTKFTRLPSSSSLIFFLPSIEEREEGKRRGLRRRGRGWAGRGVGAAARGARGATTAAGEGCARAWGAGVRARPSATAATAVEGERGAAGEGKRRGRGAATGEGERRVREALHGRENEERRNPRCNNRGFSPGKKTLAGAEEESVDFRRFGDPIDEPNALRRSPQRDERSGTLGFGRRCTD